jgi:hypothetical protein
MSWYTSIMSIKAFPFMKSFWMSRQRIDGERPQRTVCQELKHFTCIDDPYKEPLNAQDYLKIAPTPN